jgi:hypothetical protein
LLVSACGCCRATSAARFSSAKSSRFLTAVFVEDGSMTLWKRLYWIDLRVGGAVAVAGLGEGAVASGARVLEGAGPAGFVGGGSWLLRFLADIILCDDPLEDDPDLFLSDLLDLLLLLCDMDMVVLLDIAASDDVPFPFDSLLPAFLPFWDLALLLLPLLIRFFEDDLEEEDDFDDDFDDDFELMGSSMLIAGDGVSSGDGDDDEEECALSPRSLRRTCCCCRRPRCCFCCCC